MAAESMVFWELSILVLDFFLLSLLQQRGVQAENYVVGGHSVKWALPQMTGHNVSFYSAWAADKKFQLGDNLGTCRVELNPKPVTWSGVFFSFDIGVTVQ
jgi:hypothetical protein